jgi:hypothetical protein
MLTRGHNPEKSRVGLYHPWVDDLRESATCHGRETEMNGGGSDRSVAVGASESVIRFS